MRNRPLSLILSSCVFLIFPIQLGLEIFAGYRPTSIDWVLSILFPSLLTLGLLKVDKFAWYTLFGFIFLWGIKDYQGMGNEETSLPTVLTHILVYLLGLAYFINPRIKRLYFDPKLQWWRTKKRFEIHGPAIIQTGKKVFYPQLRNISEGGCFLETPHIQEIFQRLDLIIPLPVPFRASCLKFKGEVRWVSETLERTGMGIQFLGLTTTNRKILKRFIKAL